YAAQIQNDADKDTRTKTLVQEQWELVAGNIKAACQESHLKEAKTAKAWELDHVWEPSPFPVELPAAERTQVSEPAFSIIPWIARPAKLLSEMPDQPGEVRFAKEIRDRNGRGLLLDPLTREEAEKRHQADETYATAERLSDGGLLTVRRLGPDPDSNSAY